MDEATLAKELRRAGLMFLGWPDDRVSRVPVSVAGYAVSCSKEDGRIDVKLDYSDSEWQRDANNAWFDLCSRVALFGKDREFLVAVALRPEVWPVRSMWAKVALAEVWDIVGEGASGILGAGRYVPEFVMLSMEGEVIVQGTVWQDGIGFLAVPNPRYAPVLRQQAEFFATWEIADPDERLAARSWLDAGVD